MRRGFVMSVLATALGVSAGAQAATSSLWGVQGELFDPTGRMMDWSYAGYHYGEDPLPDRAATIEVTDHGATGDGITDDTAAFLAALEAAADSGGVVHVPSGTFVITDKLTLPSGVVLSGDGPGQTTLYMPSSLTDVQGNAGLEGGGTSSYAFSQAFIEGRGDVDSDPMTMVVAAAERGDDTIEVGDASGFSPGDWIRITQTDVGGALMDRLHADLQEGGEDNIGDRGMNFHSRVASIADTTLVLERTLPVDIDLAWSPDVRPVSATVAEMGIEHLTIEFPLTTYPGHFSEQGYNAIDFREVAHSWVRDVEILNADYGVNVRDSYFVTVADVVLDTTGDRGNLVGHHGLNNGHGSDNLFIGFDIRATFVHDLTNEWYATGVVFTKGRGDNLRMDHHRAAPYATLWTELDCGAGTAPFVSGGSSNRGPHSAAYDMQWNVRAAAAMELPSDDFGPRLSFVGFQTDATEARSRFDWWLETTDPDEIEPANIWEAMVERRLGPDDPGGGSTGGEDEGGSDADDQGLDETDGDNESGDNGGPSDADDEGLTSTTATAGTGTGSGASANGTEDGCSCTTDRGPTSSGWALLLLLAVRRRR